MLSALHKHLKVLQYVRGIIWRLQVQSLLDLEVCRRVFFYDNLLKTYRILYCIRQDKDVERGRGGGEPLLHQEVVCVCVCVLCNLDWSLFQPLGGQVWGGLWEPLLPRHSQLLPGQENQWGLCKCHRKWPTRGTKTNNWTYSYVKIL